MGSLLQGRGTMMRWWWWWWDAELAVYIDRKYKGSYKVLICASLVYAMLAFIFAYENGVFGDVPGNRGNGPLSEKECLLLLNSIRSLGLPEECLTVEAKWLKQIDIDVLCARKSQVYGSTLMRRLYPQCLAEGSENR